MPQGFNAWLQLWSNPADNTNSLQSKLSDFGTTMTVCTSIVSHLTQRHTICATRRYPEPFDATQHRLCTILQMSAKLFAIELVHFTISCSNSTWATRPFIIWLNYPCLGCSVSRRKTKPSIIWPCHSFISYSILQLILSPALYLLVYLTSLYFWWWRPP